MSFNPFSLEGKTIVVTGASSGIGRQCAISCSQMGANVVLMGRSVDRLKETYENLVGSDHSFYSVDLTETDAVMKAVTDILESSKIDGLLNCAGVSATIPLKFLSKEKMESMFDSNVFSSIELTRCFIKKKGFNKGASIIFLASVMGILGDNCKALYSMTKGALISAVRSLAVELAPDYRVNVISPGIIITPINKNLPHIADPSLRQELERRYPLGFGKTEDVANTGIFLLSNASKWMTGQNIILDGGFSIQ